MRLALTMVVATMALVACGGGGGSDSTDTANPTNPVNEGLAVLTSSNYVAVAQEALSTSSLLLNAGSLVLGAQVSDPGAIVRFAQQQLLQMPLRTLGPATAVGATQTYTEPCDGGGSVTETENDQNANGQVDAGDSLTLTANNCRFAGQALNGEMQITLTSVNGNPGETYPWSVNGTISFRNFAAQERGNLYTANGNMVLALSARSDRDQDIALNTPNFAVTNSYNGVASSQTLTDYSASLKTRLVGGNVNGISSVQGTLTSSALGGKSVTVQTPTPFTRVGTQANPSSGQAIITGAGASKVKVQANNATTVTISLDADGNDIYETSVTKAWSELL